MTPPLPANVEKKPPLNEIGTVNQFNYALSGGVFVDWKEYVDELTFPNSVDIYKQMRNDAQCQALLLGTVNPIMNHRIYIDPNGCNPKGVERLSANLGLPIKGKDLKRRLRNKDRFTFRNHLREVLNTSLQYGFTFYEQIMEYNSEVGGYDIHKLGARMPWTIQEINVASDGGLNYIKQTGTSILNNDEIPVNRLIGYVWDKTPGDWVGRSMFRALYRNWWIKDVVLRVGAINIERAGAGVPIFTAPNGATDAQIAVLNDLAQQYKAGEAAGMALPFGTDMKFKGVEGTQPDAAGYIRLQDEQMARAWMMMKIQLGSTETGSRALGESFGEEMYSTQLAIANWAVDIFNSYMVEDWVDWNFGPDEPAPFICIVEDDPILATADFKTAIDAGILQVDDELEDFFRSAHSLPVRNPKSDKRKQPSPAAQPSAPAAIPAEQVAGDPFAASNTATHASPQGGRLARLISALRGRSGHVRSPYAALLPDRELRRQPYDHELKAHVNFRAIDDQWEKSKAKLMKLWPDIKEQQVASLVSDIEAAGGDLTKLSDISAPVLGVDELHTEMLAMAESAADEAVAEAVRQGHKIKVPAIDSEAIKERAQAVADVLARDIGRSAVARATSRTGGSLTAAEVAAEVQDHLEGLKDAYIDQQLSGATTQAQNAGRYEVFAQDGDEGKEFYSSELLDSATCGTCREIDGMKYDALHDLMLDYPTGGYKNCEGAERCRGLGVVIYASESEASK